MLAAPNRHHDPSALDIALVLPGGGMMGVRYFGAEVRRIEDPKLLTGQGRYVADLKIPGARFAAP